MKKTIVSALASLALITSIQAQTSSFTGLARDTDWNTFVNKMDNSSTAKTTFANSVLAAASTALTSLYIGAGTASSLSIGDSAASGGVINLDNAAIIAWEASPAATDVTLTVNSSEQFVFSNAILSPAFAGTSTGTYSLGGTMTLVSPIISTGLTASGSAANTFAGSTGTFITSTGANTLSGAVTVNDATTPSLTLAAGKTNSGFFSALGKTSGGIKILPLDASGQLITVTNSAQTVGAATLTIPDFAGVADTFVFGTLAQSLSNKTLVTPNIGAATGTSLTASGLIKSTSASAGIGYATGAGGTVTQITNRSTGVTMSPNPCLSGAITTDTTSLAAEGSADFVVTDSAVAIGDVVVVSIRSGSNGGGTIVSVSTVTSGTFTIRVHNGNVAAGTAETGAIIINFAIIKAVSA